MATSGELGGSPDAERRAACDDLLVRPTVLIVDDHSGFRSLARALLEAEGFDVVGEAEDGVSALVAIEWRSASGGARIDPGRFLLPAAAGPEPCPRVHLEERTVGECAFCAGLVTA